MRDITSGDALVTQIAKALAVETIGTGPKSPLPSDFWPAIRAQLESLGLKDKPKPDTQVKHLRLLFASVVHTVIDVDILRVTACL